MTDTDAQRLQMVNAQLRTCDINDRDLLAAFAAVPREKFVAPAQAGAGLRRWRGRLDGAGRAPAADARARSACCSKRRRRPRASAR